MLPRRDLTPCLSVKRKASLIREERCLTAGVPETAFENTNSNSYRVFSKSTGDARGTTETIPDRISTGSPPASIPCTGTAGFSLISVPEFCSQPRTIKVRVRSCSRAFWSRVQTVNSQSGLLIARTSGKILSRRFHHGQKLVKPLVCRRWRIHFNLPLERHSTLSFSPSFIDTLRRSGRSVSQTFAIAIFR